MDPISIDGRYLIVFEGSIMSGRVLHQGMCWYDGQSLTLEREDGCKTDISALMNLVERPLTGFWAEKYPKADYYVEVPFF